MEKNKMETYINGYMDALMELQEFIWHLKDNHKNFEILENTIDSKIELFYTLESAYNKFKKEK